MDTHNHLLNEPLCVVVGVFCHNYIALYASKLLISSSLVYLNLIAQTDISLVGQCEQGVFLSIAPYIDEHQTWKEHINNICSKAIKSKAFLQGNLQRCPTSVKSNCYMSLLRPVLEYTATVWSPHLLYTRKTLSKRFNVVLPALLQTDDFSYCSIVYLIYLLNCSAWPLLQQRRNF